MANGVVYVTTSEQGGEKLGATALEADTGDVRWSATDGRLKARAPRHLAATAGELYYSSFRRLVARDAETGDRLWEERDEQVPAEDGRIDSGAPAVVGDRIYVVGTDVFVIDRSDGSVLGRYNTDDSTKSSVAVADDWLYGSVETLFTSCDFV